MNRKELTKICDFMPKDITTLLENKGCPEQCEILVDIPNFVTDDVSKLNKRFQIGSPTKIKRNPGSLLPLRSTPVLKL